MSVENSPTFLVPSFNSSFYGTSSIIPISKADADLLYLKFPQVQASDVSFSNISVSGSTNFTELPTCPMIPSTSSQLTNKTYVDVAAYENTVITSDAAYVQPQSTYMRNIIIYTGTINATFILPVPPVSMLYQTFMIFSTGQFIIKVNCGFSFNYMLGRGLLLNGNNGPTIPLSNVYTFKFVNESNNVVRYVYY